MIELTVPVRQLAEFCHRRGDIDYRFTPSPTGEQGIAGHQAVYKRRGSSYQPEYALETTFEYPDLELSVRGRADGYDVEQQLLEEIKTCRVDPAFLPESAAAVHWAQAKLYGALLMQEQPDLTSLCLQLTWFNIDSEEEHGEQSDFSRAELLEFLEATLEYYLKWLRGRQEWKLQRDASIHSLKFPFADFRSGQRDLAEVVYKCVASAGQLLLQAPTGIGKTAAVIYPALKAIAARKHDTISFVTSRTVGRRAAEDSLAMMSKAGLKLRSLSLTAKDTVCFSPGKACHGDDCDFAKGYYDRLPDALAGAMQVQALNRAGVEALAREYTVCPYQLAMDLVPWVDMSIGDVHYVFSYHASLSGHFQASEQRWSVLLDEAHNLPGRARKMFSAQLRKSDVIAVRRASTGSVKRALDRCNRECLALQNLDWNEPEFHIETELPDKLLFALQSLVSAISELQVKNPAYVQQNPQLMDLFFNVLQCLRVAEAWGEDYRMELSRGETAQSLVVNFSCIDGARQLRERLAVMHAIVAFSATVSPAHWVMSELGLSEEAVFVDLPSPFLREQYVVQLHTGVDTRYRARQRTLPDLAATIVEWLQGVTGNCIVYFPSYHYMQTIIDLVRSRSLHRHVMVQQRESDERTREHIVDTLKVRDDVVAFCILGGVFGEGIDLPGDALRSVVIVGVGLPQFNRSTQTLSDYYQQRYGRGFEYAYQYPGMQKVSQALGRVIRADSDTGSALLIDSRYRDNSYRLLLPNCWDYSFSD